MLTEELEIPNGWPLGLENMSMRLRVPEHAEAAAAANATVEPRSFRASSSSFSSYSSSNLDTEDNSVSLGRLIGIRHGDTGRLYFPNTIHVTDQRLHSEVSQVHGMEMSCGICVPQLCGIIVKMSRSKSSPRQ